MWSKKVFLILACILHSHSVLSIWSCSEDADCSSPSGSVCQSGMCVCPSNQQLVLGGTACASPAPYLTSPCMDDLQCTNLITSFQCRRDENTSNAEEGQCDCMPGFHYFIGRCWKSVGFGGACDRHEECFGALRDPYNMACNEGKCGCSSGYYERQRGECRKIGHAVGDGCVLNEDCQFTNGVCDPLNFRCIDSTNPITFAHAVKTNVTSRTLLSSLTRSHGNTCDATNECPEPFLCSAFGFCVCPRGYYPNAAGTTCFAELGTTSTEEQCTGFLAVVTDGVCGCPANVYFDENMRDCVKATRRITDSCVNDQMCHTFGAATRCGAEQETFFFRNCECIPEQAVWDADRNMCRLFAGIGEICEEDSDCLAGNLEILCIANDEGQGICTCPEGTANIDGLCLTTGLSLGEECQATQECTETEHTVCDAGRCSCDVGYQESGDICAPTIGSPCLLDTDCAIEHTVCFNNTDVLTCQCDGNFLEYSDTCWPTLAEYTEDCGVTLQCTELLGSGSNCTDNTCVCRDDHHFRDGRCWPRIGLFETCSRSSECYLGDITNRVQCRNSICQCSFEFPYSEELHTCTLYHVCANSDECNDGLICGTPNITGTAPLHLRVHAPSEKICLCDADTGFTEKEHTCNDADILQTSLLAIFLVSCIRNILAY